MECACREGANPGSDCGFRSSFRRALPQGRLRAVGKADDQQSSTASTAVRPGIGRPTPAGLTPEKPSDASMSVMSTAESVTISTKPFLLGTLKTAAIPDAGDGADANAS